MSDRPLRQGRERRKWADLGGSKWEPVSAAHWFGTNIIGQDIFSRAIYATSTAFEVGVVVAVLATIIGGVLGAFAGFFAGSWIDELLLWVMNVLDAIPFYLFVAAVAYSLAGSPYAMHVAMITSFWIGTGRLVRGEVIKLRNMEYIGAAYAIGLSRFMIIFRHILPVILPTLLTIATLDFAFVMLAESALSFLGIGIQAPEVTWGLMVSQGRQYLTNAWWLAFWPGLAIILTTMSLNLLSSWMRVALNPTQRWRLEIGGKKNG